MKTRAKKFTVALTALAVFAVLFAAPIAASYNGSHYFDHTNDSGNSVAFRNLAIAQGFSVANGYPNINGLTYFKYDHGYSGTEAGFTIVLHHASGSDHAYVDWTAPSGIVVYFVFVKQGDGGTLYGYKNGATTDTDLLVPNSCGLSHVSFWYGPAPTSTPAPTATLTPDPTSTPTPSDTPTPTPSDTPTPTPSDTPTPTPSDTPTPTPSDTPTPEPSDSPTPTPSDTPTPEPSDSPTPIPSDSPTPIPSDTPAPTASPTPEILISDTPPPLATITAEATVTEPPLPTTGGVDSNLLYLLGSALVAGGLMLKRRRNDR
jgi:LPXTG-motif cell wall-anchored protein